MEIWAYGKQHRINQKGDGGRPAAAGNWSCVCSVSVARKSRCSKRGMTALRRADVPNSTPICLGSRPQRIMVLLCAAMGLLWLPRVRVGATEVHNDRLWEGLWFSLHLWAPKYGNRMGHWSPSLLPNSSSALTGMNEEHLKILQMWRNWSFAMRTMTSHAFFYQQSTAGSFMASVCDKIYSVLTVCPGQQTIGKVQLQRWCAIPLQCQR